MGLLDIIKPRITELGKIKIGGKGAERASSRGGTYRIPEKYDHFVITTLQRTKAGDLVPDAALMQQLKDEGYADADGKIRQIPIALLSDDLEEIMQASYLSYVGKRVAATSDGITLTRYADKGQWIDTPIIEPWRPELLHALDAKKQRIFKQHLTFNCIIAAKSARWGGVYKFRTTSEITASQLGGTLMEIQQLTGGVLRGIPLRLVMRPMQVSPEGKTTTVYVVHCELIGDDLISIQNRAMELTRNEAANKLKLEQFRHEYKRLLKAPADEPLAELEDMAEEFHNDTPEREPVPMPTAIGEEPRPSCDTDGEIIDDNGINEPPPVQEPVAPVRATKTKQPRLIEEEQIPI